MGKVNRKGEEKEKEKRRRGERVMRRADDAAQETAIALPLGAALFAAVLALYLKTAYPTVPGGDAGELVFTSCSLGVAHPPGETGRATARGSLRSRTRHLVCVSPPAAAGLVVSEGEKSGAG